MAFLENPGGELVLLVTWAIMLCTIISPVVVGAAARRLKSLSEKHSATDRRDALQQTFVVMVHRVG